MDHNKELNLISSMLDVIQYSDVDTSEITDEKVVYVENLIIFLCTVTNIRIPSKIISQDYHQYSIPSDVECRLEITKASRVKL